MYSDFQLSKDEASLGPKKLKKETLNILDQLVQNKCVNKTDRLYYPTSMDIWNHIYKQFKAQHVCQLSKFDQEKLQYSWR